MENLRTIIESLLFISEEPLSVERIKKVLETVERKEIREALNALAEDYDSRKSGILLREVAGGFQLRTHPDNAEWIKRLIQPNPVRLSKASLETLAIIAYKQPIIRSDIEHIRGVDCGGVLRMLLERKLIRVLGRKEIPGRPLIYATTKFFLELFDLKDLKDLPTLKEIEALGATSPADREASDDAPSSQAPGGDRSQPNGSTSGEDLSDPEVKDNTTPEL
jgi:segregation and condensation protein B